MTIFITGIDATRIIRASRTGAAPALIEPRRSIKVPDPQTDLKSPEVRSYLFQQLHHADNLPLVIRTPSITDRVRHPEIFCRVTTSRLPPELVRILPLGGTEGPLQDAGITKLMLDSPLMDLLMLADSLDRHAIAGSEQRRQADILVIDRMCEYCGTYSLNPFAPNEIEATYELEPVLDLSTIWNHLAQPNPSVHRGGLRRLRIAAKYAKDRCASPSETLAAIALTAMPRLGGLHLPNMKLNEPLDLSSYEGKPLHHKRLTPDFYFPDIHFVLEIQGAIHKKSSSAAEDTLRAHDYEALGIEAIFTEAAEYATPSGINGLALEVAARIDFANNNDNQMTRVKRLIKSKEFRSCQELLFESLFNHRS